MVRVLIVDDVPKVRSELRVLLGLTGGFDVVGEAGDGAEAIAQVERLEPDVVVMDLELLAMDGYAATRAIKSRWPACRVIVLTVHGDESERQQALAAGADEFIVKGAAIELLINAAQERNG